MNVDYEVYDSVRYPLAYRHDFTGEFIGSFLSNHPSSIGRLAPPQVLEPPITAAACTVVFVTDRVFLVIVLVVILGRVKLGGLHNLSHNRFLEGLVLLQ